MMFRRMLSLPIFLLAPALLLAQENERFEQAAKEVQQRYVELFDAYLEGACYDEARRLAVVHGENSATAPLSLYQAALDIMGDISRDNWPSHPVFYVDPDNLYDPATVSGTLYVATESQFVLDALEFMGAFNVSGNRGTPASVAEMQVMRSKVASLMAMAGCLRADEPLSRSQRSEDFRKQVLLNIEQGKYCLDFDLFVQRYLDIEFDALSLAEREEAGLRAYSDHDAYLIETGIAAECQENS